MSLRNLDLGTTLCTGSIVKKKTLNFKKKFSLCNSGNIDKLDTEDNLKFCPLVT